MYRTKNDSHINNNNHRHDNKNAYDMDSNTPSTNDDHQTTTDDNTATAINDVIAATLAPGRFASSRKGQNGKVLVVGGSYLYHGAPILASLAALRFGSDLVYTAVPKHNVSATRSASPDLIVIPMADAKLTRGSASKLIGMTPTGIDSVAIGMGLAIQERGALFRLLKSYTNADTRVVLDASALVPEVLPILENTNSIVTPHEGEFKHMFGEKPPEQSDMKSRIKTVQDKASKHGITIILKGKTDVISDGDTSYLCNAGSAGMTTGGTGDVMTGLVAGALAVIREPLDAAIFAAYVNGKAGEIISDDFGYHMVASDLLRVLPSVLCMFDSVYENPDTTYVNMWRDGYGDDNYGNDNSHNTSNNYSSLSKTRGAPS